MRKIEIEELKKLQLDILKKVDTFCRSNDIKYTLFYGTLIGAIRHKGYIPWDDDIDIAMTRPNYNKFLHSFNGFYDELHVLAPELNFNYYAPYANVCDKRTLLVEEGKTHRGIEVGVKIDVFPVDGLPSSDFEFCKLRNKLVKLNRILTIKRQTLSFKININNIKYLIRKIEYCGRRYSKIQEQIINIANSRDYATSEKVDNIVFPFEDARLDRHCYENYIDVDFETYKLMSIVYYDELLTKIYGDYMQLPPEEDRIPCHGFTAYWKY